MSLSVMKQALDALEKCRDWPGAFDKCSQAIAALRQAIEQTESGGPAAIFQAMADAIRAGDGYHETLRRYRYAEVGADQQEPVGNARCPRCWEPITTPPQCKPEQAEQQEPVAELRQDVWGGGYVHWLSSHVFAPGTLLFASPPQRNPEPLTDEEIRAVIARIDPEEQYMPKALRQFAKAIEAKVVEKNRIGGGE